MKMKWLVAACLAAAPTAAAAMDVGTFLAKADALRKKGVLALWSDDYGLLKGEVVQATQALRLEQASARKSGRKPAFCAPESARLQRDEILSHFRSIPKAQQARTQVKDALRGLLARKHPCR